MKRFVLAAAVFVAAAIGGYAMQAHATTCHTSCYTTIGNQQYCNTICY